MLTPLERLHALLDGTAIWQRSIELKRGEPLVLPGAVDRNLYRIDRGTVVSTLEIAGAEQCSRFGYAGDYVMSLDSYISGAPTAYGITALRRSTVAVASFRAHLDFISQCPERLALWEEAKGWLILGLLKREVDLLTPTPEERYNRVMERSPRLFQEVPAKYIANYLRMTPETLSRIRRSGQ